MKSRDRITKNRGRERLIDRKSAPSKVYLPAAKKKTCSHWKGRILGPIEVESEGKPGPYYQTPFSLGPTTLTRNNMLKSYNDLTSRDGRE